MKHKRAWQNNYPLFFGEIRNYNPIKIKSGIDFKNRGEYFNQYSV
ncbi:MAG TPA: hypothetical protein PKH79_11110 [Prolixibacteraceae bacterium]|nr:hypothetical protein [Prolixibacteraceae bacterium]